MDPSTDRDEDEREGERDEEKRARERTEEGDLASENEMASVYSVRVRRISSADKTDRTSGARCEFRMSVKHGRIYATASVGARSIHVVLGCYARTDRFIRRIPSHRCRVASVSLQTLEMKPGQFTVFS